jgi:GrpB-like predicted nucleotidyltransferase (UPF0157 family)
MSEPVSTNGLAAQPEMQNTPVHLERPDPSWPALFVAEAAAVEEVIGERVLAIEHVGSTAVSGISAKPIIDIAVTIRSFDEVPACAEGLARIGYEYVPEFEEFLPNRRYIHMYEDGHVEFVEYLLFREYLRRHDEVAREYEQLKRDLAARLGRRDYTRAKAPFIRSVIDCARAEGVL